MKQIEKIERILDNLGIEDSSYAVEKLRIFHDMVAETNPRLNLMSKMDTDRIVENHFFDSMGFAKYADLSAGASVLDLGTGGGFPGVILAVLYPDLPVVLVESRRKKTLFLSQVKDACGLSNVRVVCSRAEDMDSNMYNVSTVMCRSVAKLPMLVKWAWHLLDNSRGQLLTVKGPDARKEIQTVLAMKGRFSIGGVESEPFDPFPEIVRRPDRTIVTVYKNKDKKTLK